MEFDFHSIKHMYAAYKSYKRLFICILLSLATLTNLSPLVAEVEPPFKLPKSNQLKRVRSALITTNRGELYIRLYPELAPWHVANFKFLSDQGFYNNLKFHMYESDYMIQTGAPTKKPNSGPGYTLAPEFNQLKHTVGTLSMVRRPNDLDVTYGRRSHGSQFRIILKNSPHMDGQYTAFGQIMRGYEVLNKLRKGDKIIKVQVYLAE